MLAEHGRQVRQRVPLVVDPAAHRALHRRRPQVQALARLGEPVWRFTEKRAAFEEFKLAALLFELDHHPAPGLGGELREAAQQFARIGSDEFRRRARGRRAQVGGEVRDGEIDLVPDRGDDRNPGARDRPCDDLLIKLPQILRAPAAAPDDDHIHRLEPQFRKTIQLLDRRRDLLRGPLPLHPHRAHHYAQPRRAAP